MFIGIPTTKLYTIDFIKFEVVSNYYYYLLKNKFFVIKYSIGSAVRQRCKTTKRRYSRKYHNNLLLSVFLTITYELFKALSISQSEIF